MITTRRSANNYRTGHCAGGVTAGHERCKPGRSQLGCACWCHTVTVTEAERMTHVTDEGVTWIREPLGVWTRAQ